MISIRGNDCINLIGLFRLTGTIDISDRYKIVDAISVNCFHKEMQMICYISSAGETIKNKIVEIASII